MKPQYTREVPVASVEIGAKIYVRYRRHLPRRIYAVAWKSTHPRQHRRTLLELKAPNGTILPKYFNEADYVVEVLDQ